MAELWGGKHAGPGDGVALLFFQGSPVTWCFSFFLFFPLINQAKTKQKCKLNTERKNGKTKSEIKPKGTQSGMRGRGDMQPVVEKARGTDRPPGPHRPFFPRTLRRTRSPRPHLTSSGGLSLFLSQKEKQGQRRRLCGARGTVSLLREGASGALVDICAKK